MIPHLLDGRISVLFYCRYEYAVGSTTDELEAAKLYAGKKMAMNAIRSGANAVVGVQFDSIINPGSEFLSYVVSATGTAVIIKKNS